MPPTLDRPSPPPKAVPRRYKNEFTDQQDVRSVKVGVILTIVLWPLLVWLLGAGFSRLGHVSDSASRPPPKPSFEIQLEPEDFAEKKPEPPPDRFVETNPDAPENIPDKTRQFAARNQQVAQEKPPAEVKGEMPSTEGRKDLKELSSNIFDGQLRPPEPLPPPEPVPAPPDVPEAAAAAQAQREQTPLPGHEKFEGDSATGVGMNAAKQTPNPTNVPKPVEGDKKSEVLVGAPQTVQPRIDPQKPQPRRALVRRNSRAAILQENIFGTNNVGVQAVNAKFSQYGQYLQQLAETVEIEWNRIHQASRVFPPPGTQIVIRFRLLSDGTIGEFISVEGDSGQAQQTCKSAIGNRAPYGKWTDDMIAVLGHSQELVYSFHYQ